MWDRRFLILVAAGGALAYTYRRGVRRNDEDLDGWFAFLTIWAPAAILIGLGIAVAWPAIARRWNNRR